MAQKEDAAPQHGAIFHGVVAGGDRMQRRETDEIELIEGRSSVQQTGAADDEGHLQGFKLYLVVLGISIGYFLILLNSTVVVTVR